MKDDQLKDEDIQKDNNENLHEQKEVNTEEKLNDSHDSEAQTNKEENLDKKDENKEEKEEDKKIKEFLKNSNFSSKKDNKNNDGKKTIGKSFRFKFNFKGLLMLIFIVSLFFYIPTIMKENRKGKTNDITYTAFIENIEKKEIKRVEEKEGYIYGYTKENADKTLDDSYKARLITTRLGQDESLMNVINNNKVIIESSEPAQMPFLVSLLISWSPMLLMIFILFFMMGRINKGSGGPQIFNMGKSKAKENGENVSDVTFSDVAGIDEAKQELKEVVDFLKEPEKFRKIGAKIPKGVLLLGEPGTGKTLLAKAVAGEAKVPFFSMSGSEFVEMFVGVGASRVRDLFTKARKNAPCIVFIDEIDAVGRKRGTGQGGGNDEREQTLNQLLVEMDGFGTEETIIVLAATNRADVLDKALKRPGRFDRQVIVDMPDVKGREEILKVHAKNKKFASDVDFKIIAKKTAGMAGADLANILNEGAILAARSGRTEINMSDLEEASEKVQMGPEKRSKVVSETDKKIVAYHESGHAIVNFVVGGEDKVHKITMIPRGQAGGYTLSLPAEQKLVYSKKYFMNEIAIYFGGRAAEEIIFGKENITSGASNDIQVATGMVQQMVTKLGMSEKFGPVLLDGTQPGDMFQSKYYSEQTGKEIDDEIRSIINERYQTAVRILTENRNKLEEVTRILLEKETIMGDEFERIMLREDSEPIKEEKSSSEDNILEN
ncbi:ATP-dependent zinc metalloprotease FtsH [Fusobacterium massiliense]|uniref:ATP-dependent zinc metalloprotease FtsH n=1 Tax=Fusobacterium massiliense TaxID=1852365 RepID=UPI0028EC644C|nr:ATP-dependent zinc metalloprotease FtsH [Fusobacterium massiliense]